MDIGVRAKQEARAELATWQECYKDVAFTEARDLISSAVGIRQVKRSPRYRSR
jgi:hypothetical protein